MLFECVCVFNFIQVRRLWAHGPKRDSAVLPFEIPLYIRECPNDPSVTNLNHPNNITKSSLRHIAAALREFQVTRIRDYHEQGIIMMIRPYWCPGPSSWSN